jgi:hypothetical protein
MTGSVIIDSRCLLVHFLLDLSSYLLRNLVICQNTNMSNTPEPGGVALGLPSAAVLFLV